MLHEVEVEPHNDEPEFEVSNEELKGTAQGLSPSTGSGEEEMYWDQYTGLQPPADQVRKARQLEIEFL
eukprot:1405294-Karenia_brevis.AAC.1